MPTPKDGILQGLITDPRNIPQPKNPAEEAITKLFSDQAEDHYKQLTSSEQNIIKPVIQDAVNDLNRLTKYKNYTPHSTGPDTHEISVDIDSFRVTVKVKNGQFEEVKSITRI